MDKQVMQACELRHAKHVIGKCFFFLYVAPYFPPSYHYILYHKTVLCDISANSWFH